MKESLRKKILAKYPEWHNNPLRLTVKEMENPLTVIDSFFDCYNLPTIRACLKDWLEDALTDPEVQPKDHIYTHNDVERLIEAVFVLYNKEKNGGKNKQKKS